MKYEYLTALAGLALTAASTNAALTVSSYAYDGDAQSQPQPTTFQDGRLADLVNFGGEDLEKLTDGQLATGGWNDFEHVGFIDSGDSSEPQPRVTFDLGGNFAVSSIAIYSNIDFQTIDSVDVWVSSDGLNFTSQTSFPLSFSGGFSNAKLTLATIDVSALPDATHVRLDFFQDSQWTMLNEVEFEGTAVPEPATTALLGLGGLALILRRRK